MFIKLDSLRENILQEIKSKVMGNEKLIILSAGNDDASNVYMKKKVEMGNSLGINTTHIKCNSELELLKTIHNLNEDITVTGIIVQLPLPKGYDTKLILNAINPNKDVDMLTNVNKANMFVGYTDMLPATSTSCTQVIEHFFGNNGGMDILLIGRSDLCNNPLVKYFTNKNYTVTQAHSHTKDLGQKVVTSDIVITATATRNLIKSDWFEFNDYNTKLIIDVSTNRNEEGKLCGDVENDVAQFVDVTANPRGIGTLTVPNLMLNVIKIKGEM